MSAPLLNEDGTASMATAMMSSHHAFRRDLACFAEALSAGRVVQAADEWKSFRAALHGHHTVEDSAVFPELRTKHLSLASELDVLHEQHQVIDPLLERGDRAFAGLQREAALAVVRELQRLLAEHLDLEERVVIPHLRGARDFPLEPTEEIVAAYADGFAWSTAGLAAEVVAAIDAMLPAPLVARLPAARRAFAERCERAWGHGHAATSWTSVPGAR